MYSSLLIMRQKAAECRERQCEDRPGESRAGGREEEPVAVAVVGAVYLRMV